MCPETAAGVSPGFGRRFCLRARGGFTVDVAWASGRLVEASLASVRGGTARVRVRDVVRDYRVPAGGRTTVGPA